MIEKQYKWVSSHSLNEFGSREVFNSMARLHPHEMYEYDPEEFWRYLQTECPGVSRDEMKRLLAAGQFLTRPGNRNDALLF